MSLIVAGICLHARITVDAQSEILSCKPSMRDRVWQLAQADNTVIIRCTQVACNVQTGPRPALTTFKNTGSNKPLSLDLRDEGSGEMDASTWRCRSGSFGPQKTKLEI